MEHCFFLVFVASAEVKMKKIFKGEESIKMLKILELINDIEEYQKR